MNAYVSSGPCVVEGPESADVARGRLSRERLRLRFYAASMLCDAMTPLITLGAASDLVSARVTSADTQFSLTLSAFFIAFACYGRAYTVDTLSNWRRGVLRACYAIAVAYLTAVGIAFYAPSFDPPAADILIIAGGASFLMIFLSRRLLASVRQRVIGPSVISQAIIVDASLPPAHRSSDDVVIDAGEHLLEPRAADPLMLDRIGQALSRFDRVLIACPVERRGDWARALKGSGIQAELLIPEFLELGPLGAGSFSGDPTVVIANGMLALRERFLKRALDLMIAITMLVFLLPLLGLVALVIKLDSQGPVLFVQQRVGRGNKLFTMYKFRTMRTDAAFANELCTRDDPRVTRVGRFLRRSSIDELPQLFNVVRGEMSLVGPRPHFVNARAGDELYWRLDERYFNRHAAKPGMTGLAQSRGFRGTTYTTSDLVKRLQADLEYIKDWSIWRDLLILLRTVKVIVHANAY